MVIKSKEARDYVDAFTLQARAQGVCLGLGDKDALLRVSGDIYYRDKHRADLSIELILDCCTKSGIIKDDRYVVWHDVKKRQDKENPRIELTIEELGDWRWQNDRIR